MKRFRECVLIFGVKYESLHLFDEVIRHQSTFLIILSAQAFGILSRQ